MLAVLAGWCVAITINMSVVYGLYEYSRDGTTMTEDVYILYTTVSRLAWSVGLAWLALACINGYGGKHHCNKLNNDKYQINDK